MTKQTPYQPNPAKKIALTPGGRRKTATAVRLALERQRLWSTQAADE
jgi:hypothetical protein